MNTTMTSFYLKYRPQTIEDLDLKMVREFFARLVKSGKTHHAYLFAGPRGTGKTSAARILAKIINCDKGQGEPCNKCDACVAITRGNWPDLMEIDAASNRGIDDVRALRETVGLAPLRGRNKVYLIDEAHMLTPEAFNALLKTLEEPPEQVVFVLATTEPDKLPETVVSRCIRVNFNRASKEELRASLAKIVTGEKLRVETGAVEKLIDLTEGSFRDAQKLLEQAVAGREKQAITAAMIAEAAGSGSGELLDCLLTRDRQAALEEIDGLAKAGANWKNVVLDLAEKLRLEVLGQGVNWQDKKELLERLVKAGSEIKDAVIPQLPLELLVVEWCTDNDKLQMPNAKLSEIKIPKKQSKVKFEDVQAKWQEILTRLKPKNHSLAGLLRSSKPTQVDGDKLVIEVFYQFHLDQLKQEKYRLMVEEVLGEVFAFPLKLQYSLRHKISPSEESLRNTSEVVKAAEEVFGNV